MSPKSCLARPTVVENLPIMLRAHLILSSLAQCVASTLQGEDNTALEAVAAHQAILQLASSGIASLVWSLANDLGQLQHTPANLAELTLPPLSQVAAAELVYYVAVA